MNILPVSYSRVEKSGLSPQTSNHHAVVWNLTLFLESLSTVWLFGGGARKTGDLVGTAFLMASAKLQEAQQQQTPIDAAASGRKTTMVETATRPILANNNHGTSSKKKKKSNAKKKNRKSPFRIRRGNLVSLRSPAFIPDDWIAVWTPFTPAPLDWTLIGKTIRCTDPSTQSHCEGIVVRVPDSKSVELLIPKRQQKQNSHIVQYDYASPDDQALQERIQGRDTVVVLITGLRTFVVRKYVPPKHWDEDDAADDSAPTTAGIASNKAFNSRRVLHIGESNDSTQQQVENWRWLAARCPVRAWPEIGKVLGVDPLSAGSSNGSIATVTIQRCLWPEQTQGGRQQFHGHNSVFVDANSATVQVPIENVVQIARKVGDTPDDTDSTLIIAQLQYSLKENVYISLDATTVTTTEPHCHRCRRQPSATKLQQCSECRRNWWCTSCWDMKCCSNGRCDCTVCRAVEEADLEKDWEDVLACHHVEGDSILSTVEKITAPVPFGLPSGFLGVWPVPQTQPCTKLIFPKRSLRRKRSSEPSKRKRPRNKSPIPDGKTSASLPEKTIEEDYSVFRPTCARTDTFDRKARRVQPQQAATPPASELQRNVRDLQFSRLLTAPSPSSAPSHRAVRANQRRNNQTSRGLEARSEPLLRFSKSRIHRWGVFADQVIAAKELIVEYRGELIGNAMAERRHEEYTRELGSDYMFRIDANQVCDATKLGNVARFINASCDPNCYTKIISAGGSKRIVIYAKRDIEVGEELSYDYKFERENDPNKRIPCHCGARDCRGFMN